MKIDLEEMKNQLEKEKFEEGQSLIIGIDRLQRLIKVIEVQRECLEHYAKGAPITGFDDGSKAKQAITESGKILEGEEK